MKVSVNLPDPERALIDVLEAAAHSSVSTEFPDVPLTGTNYHLQVDLESSDTSGYPVVERAQMRVTVHTAPDKRTLAKQTASTVLRDAYSFAGNANVSSIFPLSGRSAVSTDPDTGNEMCWVLLRVDLLASLAS